MTSNLTTPGIGGAVTTPTFTITEGNPVYFSNGKWEKYDDTLSKWSNYSGETFEAGKYRYAAQLSLKSEDHEKYLMSEDVTVTVDGKTWNIDNKKTWDNSDKLVQCMAYSTEYNVIRQYTVSFNANGGTGTMEAVTTDEVLYNLPANGFTAPAGKQFKGWATSADDTVVSGTTIDLTADTTLYAIWEDIPVTEYTITVTDGKATESAGTEISKATEGTTVTLTANAAPEGKVFDKWVIESGSITLADANSATITFTMPASAVSVKATYKSAPHTHSYGDTWNKAADKHWKSCACGEKSEEAAHTAGDWIVDVEATETTVGSKHKECTVCGYSMETSQIPAKGTPQTGKQEEPTPVPAEKGKVITDEQGSSYQVTKSDAKDGEVTLTKPKSSVKGTVEVPDTVTIDGITYKVTAIEANAFKNNKNITKVIIGKNVTVIGKNAFSGCTKLKTVKLAAAVTTIADKAFYKCSSLTSIIIPAKVAQIGKSAFEGCKKLKTITVKSTKLKSVGKRAFKGIHAKAKIKVPKSKLTKYKSLFKNKGQGKNVKVTK